MCVDFFPFIGSSLSHITCRAYILFDPHEIPKMFMILIPNKIIYYVPTRLYSSKGVVATVYINNKIYCLIHFLRLGLLLV